MPEIIIHYHDKTQRVSSQGNITVLELLQQVGYVISSPCNGKGTCGKCRVQIHQAAPPYTQEEKKHLSHEEMQKGIHLACRVQVQQDMEITPAFDSENASILTEVKPSTISVNPVLQKEAFHLPTPTLEDQRSDQDRVISAFKGQSSEAFSPLPALFHTFGPELLRQLPSIIREGEYQVTALSAMGQIIGAESGDTTENLYGVAVDIGTTTLAAYLYDLNNGERLAVASMLNPQIKYGADVISRIDHTSQSDTHAAEMANLIRSALNQLIERLTHNRGLDNKDIYLVTVAGNTTMLHLLLQLPSIQLAKAPFIPVTVSTLFLRPSELNLAINPMGRMILLPGVSAYVGADTVAAVLSSGMHRKKEITLLVDIGTNGEIVLGNRDFMLACSTAAGPAFEGANISCGTGGIDGAVSEVFIDASAQLQVKTIGNRKAIGICGSGLIDAIACMLQTGVLEETGRISDRDELADGALKYADRLIEVNGQQAFSLVQSEGYGIYITQKDVREVQNAKAAIAAGIALLVREACLKLEDIHSVYLAGGFGSFMRIRSAVETGLLPKISEEKMLAVGNAAGAGAIQALLSREELLEAAEIANRIKYLELSSRQDFVTEYTDQLFF